jgi:sulfatase modifying factor 1
MKHALVALGLVLGALPVSAADKSATLRANRACSSYEVFVPAGRYQPFFKRPGRRPVPVASMCLGAAPVSNAQYLDFVREHPEWRKSQVDKLFAEDRYLANWSDDLGPPADALDAPVTFVSWFAADAFCASRGGRLPKVAEWERFAGARPEQQPGKQTGDGSFAFAMGQRAADLAHTPLRLSGIWEWTEDFNSAVVAGRVGNAQGGNSSLFCGDGFRAVDPTNYAAFLRYSFRSSLRGDFALRNLGFRCTRDAS